MTLIRQYNEKDREQIIELWKTCNLTRPWSDPNKDFDRKNGVGEDLFIVLEFENKISGTVMGGYDGHRGIMNYLAISPDFRGKGFGKMLAEEVEKKLKQLGCPKVKLLVRSDNIEVRNFYESIDYKKQDDVSVFGKILTSSRTKMLELQRTGHKKIFDDLNENKTYNKTSASKPISHCGIVV